MHIDFAIINTDITEAESKDLVKEALKTHSINSITCPFYLLKPLKSIISDYYPNTELSCLTDFPLGCSDLRTRMCAVEQAIKQGANTVDICMPQNLAANRKYDKIRDDIKSIIDLFNGDTSKIRYILEYRIFDHHCLKKICEIFDSFNIRYVYPSSGYFIDNLADNILASVFLHQNSKDLKIICTGNMWLEKHFDTLIKSGLFGFRTTNIHNLNNFVKFTNCNK